MFHISMGIIGSVIYFHTTLFFTLNVPHFIANDALTQIVYGSQWLSHISQNLIFITSLFLNAVSCPSIKIMYFYYILYMLASLI